MAQQCVERMKEEHAPTISQQNTQEMCFMALELIQTILWVKVNQSLGLLSLLGTIMLIGKQG